MTHKEELKKDAKSLGIDPEGLKVAELEAAIQAALEADAVDDSTPVDATVETAAPAEAPSDAPVKGRHEAHAVGTSQGVHLQLGHLLHHADGSRSFDSENDFVIGREEVLVLAEELPAAAADHLNSGHSG